MGAALTMKFAITLLSVTCIAAVFSQGGVPHVPTDYVVEPLVDHPATIGTRRALFFAEQRAGSIGYIGWPPMTCSSDADCHSFDKGAYCMNDSTKTAPYFCHEKVVTLDQPLAKPVGLAVDSKTNKVFYNEDDQGAGDTYYPIRSINVDGTHKAVIVQKALDPQGLDVDASTKNVYYTEHHGQRISVVGEDGTGQKLLHTFTGDDYPSDVKVDVPNGKLFVVLGNKLTTNNKLAVMNLDGSNVTVLKSDIVRSYGITLDKANKQVYFVNGGHGGFIGVIPYGGGKASMVLENLDYPVMIAYDKEQDLLAFTTSGVGDGLIVTCTRDGNNVTKSLELGFAPMGISFGLVPY